MEEKILTENKNRFVLFPIVHQDIWNFRELHLNAFWTTKELDLTNFEIGLQMQNSFCK